MKKKSCIFCFLSSSRIEAETNSFQLVYDNYPISKGHMLVISKRHIESFFELTKNEYIELHEIINHAKKILDSNFKPDSYNVGINDGKAAGQTIPHLHIHIIPRYIGDVSDPRGGIRWTLPNRANYWS